MTTAIDLTVVGSINVDITAVAERLPAPGETVGGGILLRSAGGKGANQAAAAARLGARTSMVGAVGPDVDGDAMRAALVTAGVDVRHVVTVGVETGTAVIVVDRDGENQIAVCEGANAFVSIDGLALSDSSTVLTQLEIPLETVTELARRSSGYFALNAAPARELPDNLIERADLIIVNESEYGETPHLEKAALVAVTYGAKGAALVQHGEQTAFAPAVRATPVNSVGAGDAFCAALTIALRSGLTHEESLRVACSVGAAAVADADTRPRFAPLEHYLA